ncbi:MAG TPA: hypothetical protein VLQ45_19500, partial [Thermoanaerobaculia bacterium]|nr:hypothetical protein [Thermoanaerobaculia bacterium]
AAIVEYGVGKGKVVLIGFRPQHRAQPHRTFKILWNALFRGALKQESLAPEGGGRRPATGPSPPRPSSPSLPSTPGRGGRLQGLPLPVGGREDGRGLG